LSEVEVQTRDLGYKVQANVNKMVNMDRAIQQIFGRLYSDDRLKKNEVFIENAVTTLSKLKPQTYMKKEKENLTVNMIGLSLP